MAADALEIVSLDEIKTELRLGGEDEASRTAHDAHDTILKGQIGAAVSFVSRLISAPLVDVTETIHVRAPSADAPLVIALPYVKAVESVKYWTPDGDLRDEPDGEIDVTTLGRKRSFERRYWVWPGANGWPKVLPGSLLAAEIKRGIDIAAETRALKQAVIVCVRQFYEGYREIRPTEAFYALIDPWRRYD